MWNDRGTSQAADRKTAIEYVMSLRFMYNGGQLKENDDEPQTMRLDLQF
jgi:hypothetical protein